MANFYTDNKDLQFTLKNLDLAEAVGLREKNYSEAEKFDHATRFTALGASDMFAIGVFF